MDWWLLTVVDCTLFSGASHHEAGTHQLPDASQWQWSWSEWPFNHVWSWKNLDITNLLHSFALYDGPKGHLEQWPLRPLMPQRSQSQWMGSRPWCTLWRLVRKHRIGLRRASDWQMIHRTSTGLSGLSLNISAHSLSEYPNNSEHPQRTVGTAAGIFVDPSSKCPVLFSLDFFNRRFHLVNAGHILSHPKFCCWNPCYVLLLENLWWIWLAGNQEPP